MYRGSTTDLIYEFETVDLSKCTEIWITIEILMKKKTFKLSNNELVVNVEENYVTLPLSQEDTLAFSTGIAKTQARFYTENGKSFSSEIGEIEIEKILQGGVIS